MKIIIIGGTGTIGTAVTKLLQDQHEVIRVGASQGDLQVDMTDYESIEAMYK